MFFSSMMIFFMWIWRFSFSIINLEFEFSSFLPFVFSVCLDLISLIFFFTVFLISFCIFKYSKGYLEGEVNFKRFNFLLLFFVISMIFLIFSGSIYTSYIGWDFLGLSSLLLIFFYQNYSALKAGILTFFVNRLGDSLFTVSIIYMMTFSLNVSLLSPFDFFFKGSGVFFLLMGLTKSAQLPFSSWLPAAMQAPTPVSSLVHSSTLVTAGFFMLFRYFDFWASDFLLEILFIISLATTFMASFAALNEMDLKKIIALSTLSHLGFMMLILSLKMFSVSLFYMIMHAFFKALLFMTAGMFIHLNSLSQDIRKLQSTTQQNPIVSMIFIFSLMSMSGFPFLTGFFSKDAVLDLMSKSKLSMFSFFFILMTVFMTVLYSFRLSFFMFPKKKTWNEISDDSFLMILPMLPLLLGSVFFGSALSWFLFKHPNFYSDNPKNTIMFVMIFLFSFFWFLLFFYKKNNIFFSKMWFISILTDFFFKFKNIIFKNLDFFLDLQGIQGYFLSQSETFSFDEFFLKFSQYFLGNTELFSISFFVLFFWLMF